MSEPAADPTVLEGRVVHKKSNALQITFHDGPGEPFAVGVQGAGDGRGAKLGVLFGFKNGGTGNHRVTFRDGRILNVASKDSAPSVFTDGDGAEVATIRRGETSTAVLPGGAESLHFLPLGDEAKTVDLYRLAVTNAGGAAIGTVDIIRRSGGWTLGRALDAAWNEYIWFERAGRALPIPFLGARVVIDQPVSDVERLILVGACVDIAIGLRPYVTAMK